MRSIEFESVSLLKEGFVPEGPRDEVSVVDHHHELEVALVETECFAADVPLFLANLEKSLRFLSGSPGPLCDPEGFSLIFK